MLNVNSIHIICPIVLSLFLFASAAPTLEQIFEVATGNVPGSCDAHLPLLQTIFQEIQQINANTVSQIATDKYDENAETRKLLKSLFGINPTADGKEPTGGLDLEILTKVREWFGDVNNEVTIPETTAKKARLFCDSNFMQYLLPDDVLPNSNKIAWKALEPDGKAHFRDNHVFLIINEGREEFISLGKVAWGKAPWPSYPNENNPTFCGNFKWYGWTLEASPKSGKQQPAIILCPDSFTKKNIYNEDIPDQLDMSPQPDGKVLDHMEPRSLTLYHELFHLVFDPVVEDGVERSPDPNYWRSKKNSKSLPIPDWPGKKSAFIDTQRNIHGAVEAMYLGLYDMADPVETDVNALLSTKAPESYAWFAVANYLSTVGSDHQDWSTGACRNEGSDVMTVTVTRGKDIPKRTASIESYAKPIATERARFTA